MDCFFKSSRSVPQCVVVDTLYDQEERWIVLFKEGAQPHGREISTRIQQQYGGSKTIAVFQALAFVPVVTVYVCGCCAAVVVERRQHFRVQRNDQEQTSSDLMPELRSIQQQQRQYFLHMLARPCFPFSTCDAPGISSQPRPEGESFIL